MRPAGEPIDIAAAQYPVCGDISGNAAYISKQIKQAASRDATVVQFPETALSGYPPRHWPSLSHFPWDLLNRKTEDICQVAARCQTWVILGSMQRTEADLPTSCLHIISNQGEIVATYAKQRLYNQEKQIFSSGNSPCVVSINGYKCGFLICYDNCFPELYQAYRNAGVGLLFHSFLNAQNSGKTSIQELMMANLLVRAADNQMCISAANSSAEYSPMPACVVRPDGSSVRAERHVTSLVFDRYPPTGLGWTYDNRTD